MDNLLYSVIIMGDVFLMSDVDDPTDHSPACVAAVAVAVPAAAAAAVALLKSASNAAKSPLSAITCSLTAATFAFSAASAACFSLSVARRAFASLCAHGVWTSLEFAVFSHQILLTTTNVGVHVT